MSTATNNILTPAETKVSPAPQLLSDGRVLALLDFAAGAAAFVVLVSLAAVVNRPPYRPLSSQFRHRRLRRPGRPPQRRRFLPAAIRRRPLWRHTVHAVVSRPSRGFGSLYRRIHPFRQADRAGSVRRTVRSALPHCPRLRLRPRRLPALASLGLVTQSGYLVATSIRADLLTVVLQLGARASGAGRRLDCPAPSAPVSFAPWRFSPS